MRTFPVLFLLILCAGLIAPAVAEEEGDSSFARVYCVTFHKDGDAGCATIEKTYMAKLRKEYAEKHVLFVTADLTSSASRHQAELLLNALSLGDVWAGHAQKPATVVLAEPEWGNVRATLTSTTNEAAARAAFQKALAAPSAEEGDG